MSKNMEQILGALAELKTRAEQGMTREETEAHVREVVKSFASNRGQSLPYAESAGFVGGSRLSAEAQAAGDMLLIAKSAIEVNGRVADVGRIRENMLALGIAGEDVFSEVSKAMGTGVSTGGVEWVPSQLSPSLIDRVRLELKVAALHNRIPMPTNPYKAPIVGADAVAYVQSEVTAEDDTTKRIKTSRPSTINLTWTAKKLATRLITSDEMTEDSIVPILPFLRDQAVMALANGQEDATINGDLLTGQGTALDVDMRDGGDETNPRAAWNGYRKIAKSAAKVDLGTFSVANLRAIRAAMGKYGINPAQLAWVVSIAGYNKMLSLPEVLTLDKYGANATLLNGELGRFDNIPIVVSEFVREDLNASGVHDGVTTTKSQTLLVYRPGFAYGDRRQVTVRSREDFETEQTIIAASQRLDFQPIFNQASDKTVGVGYNV